MHAELHYYSNFEQKKSEYNRKQFKSGNGKILKSQKLNFEDMFQSRNL